MGAKFKGNSDGTSQQVRDLIKKLGVSKVKTSEVQVNSKIVPTKPKKVNSKNKFADCQRLESVKKIEFWKEIEKSKDKKPSQLFKDCDCWYQILNAEFDMMISDEPIDDTLFGEIETYIANIFSAEVQAFKGINDSWKEEILNAGTKHDFINASASLIEQHSIYNIASLDALIKITGKFSASGGTRTIALQAIDKLLHLWVDYLLPDRSFIDLRNRPLIKSHELASGNFITRNKILGIWYFEQLINQKFNTFLRNIESFLHDTVNKVQSKVLFILSELLIKKPHLEDVILPMLVNKCGDPRSTVGGGAARAVTYLLNTQPQMKKVAIIEAESLIFRMKQNKNARHYCISFLNQIVLSKDEHDVAERLISIYLKLFKSFMQEGTSQDTRILTNILSGIQRALPFANIVDNSQLDSQINTLYKIVQTTNVNTAIRALLVLMSLTNRYTVNPRYYMSFYRKLLEPGVSDSKNLTLLFNLLYRSIKHDNCAKRVSAFVKRLLQICIYSHTPFCTGGLCLLGEVLDPDDAKKRKRRRQETVSEKPVESESNEVLEKRRKFLEDSDDEEHFEDVLDPSADGKSTSSLKSFDLPGGLRKDNNEDFDRASLISAATSGGDITYGSSYKPRAMNPSFAGAETCKPWEFVLLQKHYHLSVQKFAGLVSSGKNTQYTGDPTKDFTSSRFIGKFLHRFRKTPKQDNVSPMAPRPKEFMGTPRSNAAGLDSSEQDYIAVFAKLQKELKAAEMSRTVQIGVEDIEEVGSDDEDFDAFMGELDDKEFRTATGGVMLPDHDLDLAFEEGENGAPDLDEDEDEEASDDNEESGDEFLMDSDFEMVPEDEGLEEEDDDLFLT